MRYLLTGIDGVSEWSGKILRVLIFVMIFVLIYEVTSRYLFKAPTFWAHETTQHLFGFYSVLAGAYVLLHFEHVKVHVIYERLSSRAKAIIDSITSLIFFLFVVAMLVYGWRMAWHSLMIMEVSETPFAPPMYPLKLAIPVAAFLILLQGLAHFIRSLHMAIKGKSIT